MFATPLPQSKKIKKKKKLEFGFFTISTTFDVFHFYLFIFGTLFNKKIINLLIPSYRIRTVFNKHLFYLELELTTESKNT